MRRGPAFLLALLLCAPCCLAQSTWSQHYGGAAEDYCSAAIQTADSGYAFFGRTASVGAGGRDFWLVRTNGAGTELWNRAYGGAANDYGYALQPLPDHGFALAGSTSSPGGSNWNAWVARTDSLGDTLWTKTLGGAGTEDCYALTLAADGGIVCAGRSTSYSNGGEDFWLFKLSATGDSLWSRHFGGSSMDICWAITTTPDGGFLLAGQTQSFGPGIGSQPNFWLVRTNAQGDSLWSRVYGGTGGDYAYAVTTMPGGGFLVGGNTSSYGAGSADGWLLRLNASGDSLWTRTYGGASGDYGHAVMADSAGGCLLAGTTGSNFWLVKADTSGNFYWQRTLGGASAEDCHAALVSVDSAYVLAGGTYSYTNGGQDFWVVKTFGPRPVIAASPDTILYGEAVLGLTRSDTVFVRNMSDDELSLDSISVPAGFSALYTGTTVIAPGEWVEIRVVFAPVEEGDYGGLLVAHSSAVTGDSTVVLRGRGIAQPPLPQISLSADTIAFGNVSVGFTREIIATIYNPGTATLRLNGCETTSPFAAYLWLDSVLAPGANADLELYFSPQAAGNFSAIVTVHSNAGQGDSALVVTGHGVGNAVDDPLTVPREFALSAHPNPFNPSTTLDLDLPRAARVHLALYDVTGRLVRVLADAPYAAGHSQFAVDGSDLPSGVYIARCEGGPVPLTRKLVLLK